MQAFTPRAITRYRELVEFCLAAVQTSLGSDGARAAVERHFAKVEVVVREGIEQMFLFAETSHVDAMQDYDPPHGYYQRCQDPS